MGGATSREEQQRQQQEQLPYLGSSILLRSISAPTRATQCEEVPPPPPPPPPPALPGKSGKKKAQPPPPPPPPPPGSEDKAPPPPPPPSPSDDRADSIAAAAASVSALSNPGSYEMAGMDMKRLMMLDTFGGFRVDVNKQGSPFVAVNHSYWMGDLPDGRKSSYTFVAQVAQESGFLCMAQVDPGRGSVNGRFHYPLLGQLALLKLQSSVTHRPTPEEQQAQEQAAQQQGGGMMMSMGPPPEQFMAELDFGGMTWTGNLKYGSISGAPAWGCNYYQTIASNAAAGCEGMYVAANENFAWSATIKYSIPCKEGGEEETSGEGGGVKKSASAAQQQQQQPQQSPGQLAAERGPSSTLLLNYNSAAAMGGLPLTLNYKRVVSPAAPGGGAHGGGVAPPGSPRVAVGAELACNPFTLQSTVAIGAVFNLRQSKLSVCVHPADLRIQSLLETKIGMTPGSPKFDLSAEVDHANDSYKFGYGININS